MGETKIICWNVNGMRAAARKGFLDWLYKELPDIVCLQETKAQPEQLDLELRQPRGYKAYWSRPRDKGYGGVATFTRVEPVKVEYAFGTGGFDVEARVIAAEYAEFVVFNVYFPNGKKDAERLRYKMDFYETFLEFADSLKAQNRRLIICGDFNTAHKEIDIARPRENEKVSGFLPMERQWMDKLVAHGYVDTFRHFNKEPNQYTWWDLKTRARERNIGWRIDYFFVTDSLVPSLSNAFIMPEVMGSDHCPIGITLTWR